MTEQAADLFAETQGIRKEFDQRGAILVRGVFSPAEVGTLRQHIFETFEPIDRRAEGKFVRTLSADTILKMPDVLRAVLNQRIISTLKVVLEPDYQIIPDLQIHRNIFNFADTRRSLTHLFGLIGSGWHHDAGHEGRSAYLFDPNYRVVKCGIYLQDNTVEWGGGIEVAPGSHVPPVHTGNAKFDYAALRVRHNFKIIAGPQRLKMKAGDFLAFHALLPHRGCLPAGITDRVSEDERRGGYVRLPMEHSKLVIYFNASRSACAHTYMEHSALRAEEELEKIRQRQGREVFFSDFTGLRYPEDYPPGFIKSLEENGISMAQLHGNQLARAMEIRRLVLANPGVLNCLPDAELA